MSVDVITEATIERPRREVAAYAMDPDNATSWYRNIKEIRWRTSKPLSVGTQLDFVAEFLGRTISYTYEVKELVEGEKLVMATDQGPFPMETTYTFRDSGSGTTMTLRNRGEPTGFSKMTAPLMAAAMKKANRKDLELLKEICESAPSS